MKRIATLFLLILCLATMTVNASTTQSDYTLKDYEIDNRFEDSIIVNGVDASVYQDTKSDWKKAKENGIDFAILRVTLTTAQSGTLNTDSNFEQHYNNAKDAGMMCGVYVFSQAKNAKEGREEAEFAIRRLQELGITPDDLDLPVYMDYEFYMKMESRLHSLTKDEAIEASNEFCKTVQEYGYEVGVYANTSFFESYLDNGTHLPEGASIWCAQYNTKNESASNYSVWQYSSSGIVPDIYASKTKEVKGMDVNFWFINAKINRKSKLDIFANTNVSYTGNPVYPSVEIYDGKKKLKENKDYVIRGINNINKNSESYAYIRGIGEYSGYALIPINIQEDFTRFDLPTSVIQTSYELKNSAIIGIEDNKKVKDFLSGITLSSEEYSLEVIDSQGNVKMADDTVLFSDMLGILKDNKLLGTIDINLVSETQINYLYKN